MGEAVVGRTPQGFRLYVSNGQGASGLGALCQQS